MKNKFISIKKLYHFTKFDTAIKILESHSLRFGRLHDMNDIHENDKLSYVDSSSTPVKSFPSDTLYAIDNEMARYRQISFSTDDDNHNKFGFDLHQMWGLYAEKGQGLCLVFDEDILCANLDETICHRLVSYDETVDSFYIAHSEAPKDICREIKNQVKNVFFHKRKEWEYDQEYRLIKRCPNLKNEYYLDYGDALKFIILNSVIESADIDEYKKKISVINKHVPKIPILIYGNGLLDYFLCDCNHTENIWDSSNGYNILILGKNCEIAI